MLHFYRILQNSEIKGNMGTKRINLIKYFGQNNAVDTYSMFKFPLANSEAHLELN